MKGRLAVLAVAIASATTLSGIAVAASSPSVVTGAQSSVKQTSAVLNATVNPNGSTTVYFLQWGLAAPGYGLANHPHSAGNGGSAVAVKTTAGSLLPGTVYHYRVVAYNRYGTSYGADRTLRTAGNPPPDVATGPATQVGQTFVTLTGVVNPHGATTTFYFEYGIGPTYGSQTFSGSVPGGVTPMAESVPIMGLAPGTIFHYRLVATHSGFPPSYGTDQIFMTQPLNAPTPRLTASTAPGRDRSQPFAFTTAGSIAGPGWIPAQFACSGEVKVRFMRGRLTVALTVTAVQPNCTFSAQTVLARKPGHGPRRRLVHLTVRIRYDGNGYLALARAHREAVIVG